MTGQPETTGQCVGNLRLAYAEFGGEFILRYCARPHFCSDRRRDIGRQQPTPILIEIDNGTTEHIGLIRPQAGCDRRHK